ncbi:MAG: hypothetical protein ABSC03_18360 [Verrucomicrobiota bacterium]|jgi:hypothetical protein
MPLFRKKTDPIAERERALKAHIAALEGEIKDLNRKAATELAQPKLRSTARPQSPAAAAGEPAFEDLSRHHVKTAYESPTTPSHINELGVRKYDPMATLRRWWSQFRGSPAANPKLVSYLAAGSIHGLRPLRYEKRVARNRFLALCGLFIAIIWGLIYFYFRNR